MMLLYRMVFCLTLHLIAQRLDAILRSGTLLRGRAFAHGAMGRRIDPSWGGPIELFLVPASAPRLV